MGGRQFRDQLIAAPLKHVRAVAVPGRSVQFRDQLIAAPLKHRQFGRPFVRANKFRDQLIAAPLKPTVNDVTDVAV